MVRPAPEFMQMRTLEIVHHFSLREDGGVIRITAKDPRDETSLTVIRTGLQLMLKRVPSGDFSIPGLKPTPDAPGSAEMRRLIHHVAYSYQELKDGGYVYIITRDAQALSAVHQFLRFQITEHATGDSLEVAKGKGK